ncbi:hypothetical protein RchiOBHm_Chr5g0041271 [Rosa chinensis]|uniref:Uncharacterized protein n=1 Tax=Rosa chinensis TaxID=74649 RepID=A0A2P6QCS8_ROSCH|nr:hypothetical protein RchiOBHm_Chr5g0041271 [Rosa chinensis]
MGNISWWVIIVTPILSFGQCHSHSPKPYFSLKMVFYFVGCGVGGNCDGSSWEETPKKMHLSLCVCKISYWIFFSDGIFESPEKSDWSGVVIEAAATGYGQLGK